MRGPRIAFSAIALSLLAASCQVGEELDVGPGSVNRELTSVERGRDIWFENTYGGEKFFSFVLPYHPDPTRRIRIGFQEVVNTPRDQRFDIWGVVNDPDCVANPAGGMDLCDDPESSGVVGIRYKGVSPLDGTNMFGAACAACHAGFDPLDPPADPNEPTWDNIHATIGNSYIDFGAIFGANLAPTDPRALLFAAWPNGSVDTSLLFDDGIMNPGVVTHFWEHTHRNRFEVGRDAPQLRNAQGGEDDLGGDIAALRVYTNIGVCFFECVQTPAVTGGEIDIDTCRAACPDFPPQQDLDDMGAFLATFEAPQLPGKPVPGLAAIGEYVFDHNCKGCHDDSGELEHVLSSDEVIPLRSDPINATNACRALGTNFEAGHIWGQFSSDVYKARVAAGDRGYRVMPLGGIWATSPLLHNQSIGAVAPATASPQERAGYYWSAMWELMSTDRIPKVFLTPSGVPGVPAGIPLHLLFSAATPGDPTTLRCADFVENHGHYYGAGLPVWQKVMLIYWLQYQ